MLEINENYVRVLLQIIERIFMSNISALLTFSKTSHLIHKIY